MSIQHARAHGLRAGMFLSLLAFAPLAQPLTLVWDPPTDNTNGSALVDLRAYRIYTGSTRTDLKARVTVRNPGLSSYTLEPIGSAERFFAITAINSKGVESVLSNVVYKRR